MKDIDSETTWIRAQIVALAVWIEGNPQRWPAERITIALLSISAGDRDWLDRTAGDDDEVPAPLATFEHLGGEAASDGAWS